MPTRMESVTEEIALSFLKSVSSAMKPPLPLEKLEKDFYARWPAEGSKLPMNDAIRAARNAAVAGKDRTRSGRDEEAGIWETPIADAWDEAVTKTVARYFDKARRSFDEGKPLEGTETLTDAVRAAVGFIAATREWPHATREDLYNVAEGLAAGALPKENDNVFEYPDTVSEEGVELCSFFAASMGGPDSVRFGLFYDSQDGSNEDAIRFAERTIELAGRLAKKKAVIS